MPFTITSRDCMLSKVVTIKLRTPSLVVDVGHLAGRVGFITLQLFCDLLGGVYLQNPPIHGCGDCLEVVQPVIHVPHITGKKPPGTGRILQLFLLLVLYRRLVESKSSSRTLFTGAQVVNALSHPFLTVEFTDVVLKRIGAVAKGP